ncbi:MAG: 2-phosphosulfolactate phosphatase [Gemmatimonadetes bacterium]|nr:2-phosphosulfolactate phosphatase [Gemmatimonadota bacterium]|tara:strand:- start:275141 stop:275881 length:741 start_codon:yes stop_codon:yes gene_type:complete
MHLDLFLTVTEDFKLDVTDQSVVIIDVLRTGSSIVQAMANGAQEIYPRVSTEEAIKLASSLGREDSMLCGTSGYTMTEGFDLGNSPAEFVPEKVDGKRLVMSTTNGMRVFDLVDDSPSVLVCSFMNVKAVAKAVSGENSLAVVCVGAEGDVSLEDTVCAGLFIECVHQQNGADIELNDAGRLAKSVREHFKVDKEFLAGTERGGKLREGGFEMDLDLCSQVDIYSVVPEMKESVVRLMQKDTNGPH